MEKLIVYNEEADDGKGLRCARVGQGSPLKSAHMQLQPVPGSVRPPTPHSTPSPPRHHTQNCTPPQCCMCTAVAHHSRFHIALCALTCKHRLSQCPSAPNGSVRGAEASAAFLLQGLCPPLLLAQNFSLRSSNCAACGMQQRSAVMQ